jgi:hypothetical protein
MLTTSMLGDLHTFITTLVTSIASVHCLLLLHKHLRSVLCCGQSLSMSSGEEGVRFITC